MCYYNVCEIPIQYDLVIDILRSKMSIYFELHECYKRQYIAAISLMKNE